MNTTYKKWYATLVLWLLMCATGLETVNAQYLNRKASVNAGGTCQQAGTYRNCGSVGQASPPGISSTTLSINYGGFWTPRYYTLTVLKSGSGSGKVTDCDREDDRCLRLRIYCGGVCSVQYQSGSAVFLFAYPDLDSRFVCYQVNGVCENSITVNSDLTVTAVFERCPWPSAPSYLAPADGATAQPLDTVLDWQDVTGATEYAVSFGSTFPPPGTGTVAVSTYTPGQLLADTTYHWQIGATNTCGTMTGPVWAFSTGTRVNRAAITGFYQGFNPDTGQAA